MLAALAKADRIAAAAPATDGDSAKLSKGARKRRNRRERKDEERKAARKAARPLHGCKARIDYENARVDWYDAKDGYVTLAPGELDDDLDEALIRCFGPLPAPVPAPAVPYKARHADGSIDLGVEVYARAAEIKAERTAEAKQAAAAARKNRNAEKRAAGLPLRAPAKKKVLTGRDIPSAIRGKVTVTGTINAKTGQALVIDVAFRNTVHSGIIVWAGAVQPLVAQAAEKDKAIDLVIAQPANDRFKPSVRSAA